MQRGRGGVGWGSPVQNSPVQPGSAPAPPAKKGNAGVTAAGAAWATQEQSKSKSKSKNRRDQTTKEQRASARAAEEESKARINGPDTRSEQDDDKGA